jgi:hypothetical protein
MKKTTLIFLFILTACSTNPLTTNVIKTSSNLPLSLEEVHLIQANKGLTRNIFHIYSDNKDYILFNYDSAVNKGVSRVKYMELDRFTNSNASNIDEVLPLQKPKKRYISSIIKIHNINWIYYVEADHFKADVKSYRAQWQKGKLVNIEPLSIGKTLKLRSWQKFYVYDDKVVMVHTGGGMFVSVSTDGKTFASFKKIFSYSAQPRISSIGDMLVSAFQIGNWREGKMKPLLSFSNDLANTWSKPMEVTNSHINVHDAFLFKRLDGNIDIYYVYPIGDWRGFSLFRRCLRKNHSLGSEEQVLVKEIGNVVAPSISRLNNDEILVMFNEQLSGYNPYFAILSRDSHCD